ncbi:MAG: hypothetical protein Kow0098_19570 [Ignavibacteriaceae bacterium]
MKQIGISTLFLILPVLISGCITFHTMSYEINLYDKQRGLAKVEISDIRSDASEEEEFLLDKQNLIDYAYRSDQFVIDMKAEGKDISIRELEENNGILNARIEYFFDNINEVEGIVHSDNYFVLTLEISDSIVSTNGVVVKSENVKRIIWEDTTKTLTFKMFSEDQQGKNYRDLTKFLK